MAAKEDMEQVKINEILPIIPLKELVIFPYLVVPLLVGRPKSVEALEEAMRNDHVVFLVAQKTQVQEEEEPNPEDLFDVGTAATVLQVLRLPDGTARALVEGLARGKIMEVIQTEGFLKARVEKMEPSKERRREKQSNSKR